MKDNRNRLILNVDDNEVGRYTITRILQRAGFRVAEAADGFEALRLAREGPDLILLDVKLPDISGLEVCRRIKLDPMTAGIPVVHLSAAYVENEDLAAAIEKGADGYLTHPVNSKVLVATINAFLRLKEAEQHLRESEERFRSLYENSTIGLYRTTPDGKILLTNPALVKMLHYNSTDELAARNPGQHEYEPLIKTRDFIERLEAEGEIKDQESTWVLHDGTELYVSESARVVRDAHGRTLYYDYSVSDITQRKAFDDLLRDVQRREAIGVMSSGIAHDFNNLLGAMMGNVSLAQTQLPPDHPVQKYMGQALIAMDTAAELVQQILAYSGKGKYQNRTIELGAELMRHVSLFRVSMPKNVKLVTNIPPEPVYVNADPAQIKQIIMNLIMNGGEAMGDRNGVVSVRLAASHLGGGALLPYTKFTDTALKEGEYAMVEVRDNGMGMSEDTLYKIFDPFYSTKFIGRGLGLAAVLGIIRSHEGGIAVESAPEKGTAFRLVLPLAEAPHAEKNPEEDDEAAAPQPTGTILVIDDEESIAMMAREILESGSYTVMTELNPIAGIELFRKHHAAIGAVLLDLSMPEMSGKEVMNELLAIDPHVRIILSSGYTEYDTKTKIDMTRIAGFIQKPYTLHSLLAIVHAVMR